MGKFYSECQIVLGDGFEHPDQNVKHARELGRKKKEQLQLKRRKNSEHSFIHRRECVDLEKIKPEQGYNRKENNPVINTGHYNIVLCATRHNQYKNI